VSAVGFKRAISHTAVRRVTSRRPRESVHSTNLLLSAADAATDEMLVRAVKHSVKQFGRWFVVISVMRCSHYSCSRSVCVHTYSEPASVKTAHQHG